MTRSSESMESRRYENDVEVSVTVNNPVWAIREASTRLNFLEQQLSAIAIFVSAQIIDHADENKDQFLQERSDELIALLDGAEVGISHCRRIVEATEVNLARAAA